MTIQALFASLKDMGYQQAKTGDNLTTQAQYAIDNIVGFPADIPAEARAELYAGYQLRYNDNNPVKTYAVINGHYVLATDEQVKNKKVEKVEIGVAYAFSYSSQEFGKLANTNPALHAIVKQWRSDVSDYCSNRLGDLKRSATKLLNKGKTTTRTTLDFAESTKKVFDQLGNSVKVKAGRGDTTADPAKFKQAVDAFWKAYSV
jgi:hypothetical protein